MMLRLMCLMMLMLPIFATADIFDNPENLKVLKKDISPGDLRNTMRMMSTGLGVRCQHCHVGEEGQSLRNFDFASDEKGSKEKARFMLKMMMDLNQHMVTGIKDRSVEIKCMTCHRGAIKPILTVDLLKDEFKDQGIDAALSKHDELKAQYYGSHTHDFTESTLIKLAQSANFTDKTAALKTLQKNLEIYPKSFQTHFLLAEFHAASKDFKTALKFYKKANKIKPQPWVEKKIKDIKKQL